jgi:hypothetical protein
MKWDFMQCDERKYKNLNDFDLMLHKSIRIAMKHSQETEEEGWF